MSTSLQCPLCGELDSALHILSGCKNSTMSYMVTEQLVGHNIASRILLKAISKGPLGSGIASMDIGRADRLALHNQQIPEHATKRPLPKYIFPLCFPDKDRLTSSQPDAILGGTGGTGRTQRQPQPLHPIPRLIALVSSSQIRDMSILWKANTVKTPGPTASFRPPSSSTATYVVIFQGPQLKSPSKSSC
eukprot:1138661-Pelagomonas_calceolata.AAC.1